MIRQLDCASGHYARIITLYRWLSNKIDFASAIPKSFLQALDFVQSTPQLGMSRTEISLSQRQVERHFRKWIGITPKQYQRIIRVKQALNLLKQNPDIDLVTLAFENGFSDQAHMTREFNSIAKITPRQYSKLTSRRQIEEKLIS